MYKFTTTYPADETILSLRQSCVFDFPDTTSGHPFWRGCALKLRNKVLTL
jgi:hypothetical protein